MYLILNAEIVSENTNTSTQTPLPLGRAEASSSVVHQCPKITPSSLKLGNVHLIWLHRLLHHQLKADCTHKALTLTSSSLLFLPASSGYFLSAFVNCCQIVGCILISRVSWRDGYVAAGMVIIDTGNSWRNLNLTG